MTLAYYEYNLLMGTLEFLILDTDCQKYVIVIYLNYSYPYFGCNGLKFVEKKRLNEHL